jgi:hypothetical protein
MALTNSDMHQAKHFVQFAQVTEMVNHRTMQPIFNVYILPLHQRSLLKRHLEFVFAKKTRNNEMPSSRAEGKPSIS